MEEEKKKKSKITISYDEYEKIARTIIYHFKDEEKAKGRTEGKEMKFNVIFRWC